jgi:curli biogenesis system outer membrane secretion channel CsgG
VPNSATLTRTSLAASILLSAMAGLSGCATESHQSLQVEKPATAAVAYQGIRKPIAVGSFDNRSAYLRGIFSDGVDRLGGQAKTILMGHLQETGRFNVLDRDNMRHLAEEAKLSGKQQALEGADYVISGDVVEFGRKETGDQQLFGILGSGKKQTAYSKVTLNVVDVLTSRVVYSASGAGEYALSDREVIGFGGASGYDSTLNGKVLDLAVREAVDRLVEGIEQGRWTPAKDAR